MGREIRPVALDWQHPRDDSGHYRPLHSRQSLLYALDHPDEDDEPVDLADYMPEIPEGTPVGWQLYEDVSEGTPLSPVFESKDELARWMSSPAAGRNQVSPEAAAKFVADGWAPSFIFTPSTGLISGVEYAEFRQGDQS